jgi:hypothetical protein
MAEVHYHTNSQDQISEKLCGERDVGPTCGFTASTKVGSGATVGTLHTRYPRVQASSQDKEQGMHPRVATCHRSSGTCLPALEDSDVATCPKAPDPAPAPRGLRRCHMS